MRKLIRLIILIIVIFGFLFISEIIWEKQGEPIFPFINKQKISLKGQGTNSKKEGIEEIAGDLSELKAKWQWVEKEKKLYKLTPAEINLILKELWIKFPDENDRLKALSILRLGTPYQLGCLGEESGRDQDPIFRVDATDCTAFVLTNVALLHSQTIEQAKKMMRYLNYRPWKNPETEKLIYRETFNNRLHFTTDRNEVSPYFQDITEEIPCNCKLERIEVTLNKIKTNGKRLIDIDWEKKIVFRYIPSQYVTKTLCQKLPKAVGVAFVKKGDEKIGLDVRHEGFLLDGKTLFHASSVQGKVVAEDFSKYFSNKGNNPMFDGIILFKVR